MNQADGRLEDGTLIEHKTMDSVVKKGLFEAKRGFKGSRKVGSNTYQVCCGCVDCYSKQLRKAKTKPVLVEKGHSICKICGFMPWVVLDRTNVDRLVKGGEKL